MDAHEDLRARRDERVPEGGGAAEAAPKRLAGRGGGFVRLRDLRAAGPADFLGSGLPLGAPDLGGIILEAEGERVHPEAARELLESRLDGEAALRVARCAHRAAGTKVGENVGLGDLDGGESVSRLHESAGAGAGRDAGRPERLVVDGGDRSILAVAELHAVPRVGPVAGRELVFLAVEHHQDGLASLLRELRGEDAVVAGAELRAEAAARELRADDDLVLRQLEDLGELVPHAERALRRGLDLERVAGPLGEHGVRLHADVRLDGRRRDDLQRAIRVREALVDVAFARGLRPAHVARLGELRRGAGLVARASLFLDGLLEDEGRAVLAGRGETHGVREDIVRDLDGAKRVLGGRPRGRCEGEDGLPVIADHVLARVLDHDARHPLGGRGVDRDDLRVRVRRAEDAGVEHARPAGVVRVDGAAGDLLRPVEARPAAAGDRARTHGIGRRIARGKGDGDLP